MVARAVAWSLGVHALAALGIAVELATPTVGFDATPLPVDVAVADDPAAITAPPVPVTPPSVAPPLGTAKATARSSGHGAGGKAVVTDRADLSTLRAQPYDAADGYALQRIRTSSTRESREEVRATPNPAPTPWLASKPGAGHDRHERARSDGDRVTQTIEHAGFARPELQEDPAATDAARDSDAVADDVDEPLVSDEKQPAPIELSRPTSPGPSTSGHGDGALGTSPTANGTSPSPEGAAWQRAYDAYLLHVRQKVDPLWEFPRDLAIRMEQGDVLVGFTIDKEGRVRDVRVLKGSGFDKFDKIVVRAIKKGAPFGPLPATLGAELHVTAPFEGSNPVIR